MTRDVRNLLTPILKLASITHGVHVELPKEEPNWLDIFGGRDELSQALQVECAFCAGLLESPLMRHRA